MTPSFADGIKCALKGIQDFIREKELWKYAILPLILTLICYAGIFLLMLWGSGLLEEKISKFLLALPSWCAFLQKIYIILQGILFFLLFALLFTFTLPPVFELFHGLFSDAMLVKWGEKEALSIPRHTFRENIRFFFQYTGFNIRTLLWTLLLFPLSLFIPFFGGVILWGVLAYRLGLSLLLPAGFLFGENLKTTLQLANRNKLFLWGFGLTASLTLFIPFFFPLFLPGMTIGGAAAFQMIQEKN